MNNSVILLKYYEREKAVNAPYEISSIDDYFTLIEICNNYGYIPEKINLNTDLDFADYDLKKYHRYATATVISVLYFTEIIIQSKTLKSVQPKMN